MLLTYGVVLEHARAHACVFMRVGVSCHQMSPSQPGDQVKSYKKRTQDNTHETQGESNFSLFSM